ncbi:MAG: hypothetical protein H6630_01475 [Arcobacter sp.]|nr:hypothetical protein [Arcobacter sp.]
MNENERILEKEKHQLIEKSSLIEDLSKKYYFNIKDMNYQIINEDLVIFNMSLKPIQYFKTDEIVLETKVEILADVNEGKAVPLIKTVSKISQTELKYSYSLFNSGDNLGYVTSTGTVDIPLVNCNDESNFNNCFMCAWSQITSDWIGTVSCATNPWSCGAAAALYCALIANPGNQNIYTYN